MSVSMMSSVAEARKYVIEHAQKGTLCPCCGQNVKIYKRKLNRGMASILSEIYQITVRISPVDGWVHVSKFFLSLRENAASQEYSKLRFWGLLETKPSESLKVRESGLWRLTEKGKAFVEGRELVPKSAFLYNNKLVGFDSKDFVSFEDALGERFDFAELMEGKA